MARMKAVDPDTATGEIKELLEAVNARLGMVPNMMRTMANSPAALEGYLQMSGALADGRLAPKTREQLALAIAEANHCDYCIATHLAMGKMAGLTGDQIRDSRLGVSVHAKTEALIRFARQVVETRGHVTDEDLRDVRAAGFDDGVIAEVVAFTALNIFTNYFNLIAQTDIDFPNAPVLAPAAAAR